MEKLKNEPVKLSVIGVSTTSNGQELVDRMNCMENVEYIGRIPHEQIFEYFDINDVFILPSLAEGSSLSVYEALASGMPCVVTRNTGSVVTDGIDGIIFEVKNADSIVVAVEKFVQNPELVYKMSCNAQNTMNKYSWKKYEKKIACFYKNQII